MDNQKGVAPILIVILVAALVGGYLVYQKQYKPTSSAPQPTTQPSSSTSDETVNWKTLNDYTGASSNIRFSYKYPPNLQITEVTGITSKQVTNDTGEIKEWNPGTFSAYGHWLNLENKDISNPTEIKTESKLGGRKAEKIVRPDPNAPSLVKEVSYRVTEVNLPNVDKKWGFAFTCLFSPKQGQNLGALCDQIASTLQFTD